MTDQKSLGFNHRFVAATEPNRTPLLLLHGTGGDENDLIPLAIRLAPGAALLSPRGQVSENGNARFFRRVAEGVFDVEDLNARTDDLARFVTEARAVYGIEKPFAVGFSNGANIAWALLLRHPTLLAGAVLLRPAAPFEPEATGSLAGTPVLMLSGNEDTFSTSAQRENLAKILQAAGADVTHQTLPAGHGLTPQDLAITGEWLSGH